MTSGTVSRVDQFFISVDGTNLAQSTMQMLEEAVVEDDLGQPATFVLRFYDPDLTLTDGSLFKLGAEVQLSAEAGKNTQKVILTGEVTSLEPEMTTERTIFVVRGYDYSHRLYRGRKTLAFLKKSDSQIAQAVAQAAGLQAQVDASTITHDYVLQCAQTDMEFLRERAARIGYSISASGKTIKFVNAAQSPPAAPAQELGVGLRWFRPRVSAVGQPNSVEVRGWDQKSKQAIVGSASSATATSSIGYGKTGAAAAQQAFSATAAVVVTDQPVATQSEAAKLAQAILDDAAGGFLTAEGMCFGDPSIKAGATVQISGVGTRFSGNYFITASRHEYNARDGYMTTFWTNGRQPASMLGTIDGRQERHRIDGVVPALVTNINDPDSLGRVKVKYPWLNDTQESDWARLVQPGAGNGRGLFVPPEVNDEVLVAFEQGDITRPYVIGGLWNSQDTPPSGVVAEGKVKLRTLKTRAGHILEFGEDDGANKGYIKLTTSAGKLITISDTDKKIQIKSELHTLTMDDQGRAVTIESGGTLELKGSGQKLSFTTGGIELSGPGGKLNIAAAGVELAANANLTLKANANVDLQANALMNIKSSAIMNIQGTLVKIN